MQKKRAELNDFIQREIVNEQAIHAVAVVGSVANGLARDNSDIDAYVFLDPYDLYCTPAEFQWLPSDGSFHGIFVDIEGAVQFDFKRVNLSDWSNPAFVWPEPARAELSAAWIAFDRIGEGAALIRVRTAYSDDIRNKRLDEAIIQLDQLLLPSRVERCWSDLGPEIAYDRLQSAYEYLIQALFAYNRQWRPWRSREFSSLRSLPWLPAALRENPLTTVVSPSSNHEGYETRASTLRDCFEALIIKCREEKLYGEDAVGDAFMRRNDEPGRDWNIAQWVEAHNLRRSGAP